MKRIPVALTLGIILLIALCLRVWGIAFDLPYIYHPDEPLYVGISQNIFKTGDLNPHFFNYPSLFFYLNSLAYVPYYIVGKLLGGMATRNDILLPTALVMGVAKSPMPTTILLGRLVTAVFGVGTVGVTFVIGRRIGGKASVGLLALFMMAVSPTNVLHSRLITPDTFVVFFVMASFLAAVLVYQQGKTWQYIVAGICVGLTISSKYNGGLIVLPLLLAHFLRHGKRAFRERNLYFALLSCGLGFVATTPYALLDFRKFLADVRFVMQHYSTGHAGMEGNTIAWYLHYMWQTTGIICILALLEILRGLYVRSKETILVALFPVVYLIFISRYMVRNDRIFMPLTPFLFLLAALFLVHFWRRTSALQSKTARPLSTVVVACLGISALAWPASQTLTETIQLTAPNSRETARVWIANNLPPGAKVAIESYSPFVDPLRFSVQGFGRMIDCEPEWYVEQGFDYLVFSQGMFGRFYQEPQRYAQEVSQYDRLFEQFHLVRSFKDGGYEVRIYKIDKALSP